MRKWLLRISAGLLILIVLVIVVVQIVLWTPLPKRMVTSQIEKELGLRIACDKLSTGWLGRTELTNVSLGLPLSSGDFLRVRTLKIKHSSLIGLALGNVTVDSVEVDDPVVEIVQNPQGQWNLQQVAVLLARLGGGNSAGPGAQASPADNAIPKLPVVKLVNGTVHVTDNQKRQLTLAPLNVSGDPSGALVWNYDLTIANSIAMNGKVAPGGNWQHQLTLSAHDLDPLLKGWGIGTCSADIKAGWFGQVSGGKVTGSLVLNRATASGIPTLGDVSAGGSIDAVSEGAVLTLHPNQLRLTSTDVALPELAVKSGTIISDAGGWRAQSLKLAAFGGLANVDGRFDPKTQAADLQANWSGLSLARQTSQSGSLTASLRQPFANQPVITVDLNSAGTWGDTTADALSPPGRWNAKFNLTGQGRSWQAIDWVLTAPQLTYAGGGQVYNLSQLSAHVNQRWPVVELADLSLPASSSISTGQTSATFSSNGRIDFHSTAWNFDATGGFNTSFQNTPVPVTIALNARGTSDRYDLTSLKVGISDVTVAVDGSYDNSPPPKVAPPTPVNLHVVLSQEMRILPDAPIQGELAGDFNIVGDLFKQGRGFHPYLTTTGDLRSSDLVFFGRPVGDVDVKLQGITQTWEKKDKDYGRILTQLQTTQFYLFQAPWTLSANYPNHEGVLEVAVETHRLAVDELAKFARMKGISGQVTDAKWTAKISSLSLEDLDLHSEYHLARITAKGVTADTVDITATLHDGMLKIDPLLARRGDGTATATASLDLKHPRHLVTDTSIEHWPCELSEAVTAQLKAHCNLDVDLTARPVGAAGSVTASTDLLLNTTKFAHADVAAAIRNRAVDLTLNGKIVSGTFTGAASVDLNKPLQATGRLVCQDVDAGAFATFIPSLDGIGGKFSLAATLAPARDPRPLAPVRLDLNIASTGGHFHSVQFGDGALLSTHAVAYLDLDRAVLDHSDIHMAGGLVHVWARVDDRDGRGLSAQTCVEADGLQLDQLAHIDPTVTQPIPGIVNAQFTAIRSGTDSRHVLIAGHADLTRTDLVNFGPVNALYNAMNLGRNLSDKPNGYGDVDVSFEQNILHVNSFRYFNRGIDARGLADIGPIKYDDLGATPIGGQLVGSIRPLKGSNVKILADFDQYFGALQSNLTTRNVSNTIDDMKYTPAGVADIGRAMRVLLVGDSRKN